MRIGRVAGRVWASGSKFSPRPPRDAARGMLTFLRHSGSASAARTGDDLRVVLPSSERETAGSSAHGDGTEEETLRGSSLALLGPTTPPSDRAVSASRRTTRNRRPVAEGSLCGNERVSLVAPFALRPRIRRDYPLNLSISVSGGKETNKDSPSNGE